MPAGDIRCKLREIHRREKKAGSNCQAKLKSILQLFGTSKGPRSHLVLDEIEDFLLYDTLVVKDPPGIVVKEKYGTLFGYRLAMIS